MIKTANQKQIGEGKWKVYSKTPRRFRVDADIMFSTLHDYEWCNEDKLNETIQKLIDRNKKYGEVDIAVSEILGLDWESEEA